MRICERKKYRLMNKQMSGIEDSLEGFCDGLEGSTYL
jgi:hypothetical protein